MKIYMAPMEGITGEVYRSVYHTFFEPVDKYFTPFLNPNPKGKFSRQEWNEILPEKNDGRYTVPQILTNRAEDFIRLAGQLKEMGYGEVNLNLGCPSKTVVSRKRGSGFLYYPDELNHFLAEIFDKLDIKISIKTRSGKYEQEEFEELLDIYNQYPLEELILHPRVQQDYYKNQPDWNTFAYAAVNSKNPLVYNGDIFTLEDYQKFHQKFPQTDTIMLGRGILRNPNLPAALKERPLADLSVIKEFCKTLLNDYIENSPLEQNALVKMKELWWYLSASFADSAAHLQKIRQSQTIEDYQKAVAQLFTECKYQGEGQTFRISEVESKHLTFSLE